MSPLSLLHPFRAGNRRNVAPFRSHPMHKFKTYIGRACCMASASCFQAFSNLVQQALKRLQQAPRRFPSWSCGQHHLACQTRVLCRIWRTPGCRPSPGGSKIAYDRSRGKTVCRGSHCCLDGMLFSQEHSRMGVYTRLPLAADGGGGITVCSTAYLCWQQVAGMQHADSNIVPRKEQKDRGTDRQARLRLPNFCRTIAHLNHARRIRSIR